MCSSSTADLARETSERVRSARSACFWMVEEMEESRLPMRVRSVERREGRALIRVDSVW